MQKLVVYYNQQLPTHVYGVLWVNGNYLTLDYDMCVVQK